MTVDFADYFWVSVYLSLFLSILPVLFPRIYLPPLIFLDFSICLCLMGAIVRETSLGHSRARKFRLCRGRVYVYRPP